MDDERRERRSVAERREELVEAAVTVVAQEGLANATTRRITEHAGVALGAFHYAFDSKAHLVAEVMRRISTHLEEVVAGSVDGETDDLEQAAQQLVSGYLASVDDAPEVHLAHLELAVHALRDPDLRDLATEHQRRRIAAAAEALRPAAGRGETGETGGLSLDDVAGYLLASLDGMVLHGLSDPQGSAGRRRVQHATVSLATTGRPR